MHARSRILTALLMGAMLGALMPAAAAANEIVPGRPGRFELSSITIDATTGDCRATYDAPAVGNLWMRGVDGSVRVQASPNGIHVTCRFTDMSYLIEANAEVGYTDACEVTTETMSLTGGWGIATSAANISERAEGGTSFVMCRFASELAPTKQKAEVGRKAVALRDPTKTAASRERGRRPAASRSIQPPIDTAPTASPAGSDGSTRVAGASAKPGKAATKRKDSAKSRGGGSANRAPAGKAHGRH